MASSAVQFTQRQSVSSVVGLHSKNHNVSNQKQQIYTNHYICSFGNDISLYQYNVSLEELNSKSHEWFEVKARARCSQIMQEIIQQDQVDSNVFVWYDEQTCLYSTTRMTMPLLKMSENSQYRLSIKSLTNQCSTNSIHDFINGNNNIYPYDTIRILETLLKRSIQDRIKIIKDKCYFLDKPIELPNGFIKRTGFIQALHISSECLTLQIQTKETLFYPEVSLLEFVSKHTRGRRTPSDGEFQRLNKLLKGCFIVTQQSNWEKSYEFVKFDSRLPGDIFIDSNESLIQYYKRKGIYLNRTYLPCIEVYEQSTYKRTCYLPPELCQIKEWEIYNEPLTDIEMKKKHSLTPTERHKSICQILDKCNYRSNSNLLCRAVDFTIDTMDMLKLEAQILMEPTIQIGPTKQARIRNGRVLSNGRLFEPKSIAKLAITYFGTDFQMNKNFIDMFSLKLLDVMKSFNIHVEHVQFPPESIAHDFDKIDRYFHLVKEQNYTFVVCLMNIKSQDDCTDLKACIKTCSTITYGIMTQCALLSEIPRETKLLNNYCEDLVRKINLKNGGVNTKLNIDRIIMKNNDSYMFFGADVIHPSNATRQHPSISAIVGSTDSNFSRTATKISKQYPKQGKRSIENILGMRDMVEELLKCYEKINGILPNKIVFYRDGIDHGQFRHSYDYEIPKIRQAFDAIYGEQMKHPLLTFVIVQKRHNTRFFVENLNSKYDRDNRKTSRKFDNIPIGAVIDSTIVDHNHNNFYLNSHNAYQGVNRPSHYHILLNEINLTTHELQILTYHLCFNDQRSSAAEAIPFVVHQADVAAWNARNLYFSNDNPESPTDDDTHNQRLKNHSIDGLAYEILHVHENLKNRPALI